MASNDTSAALQIIEGMVVKRLCPAKPEHFKKVPGNLKAKRWLLVVISGQYLTKERFGPGGELGCTT